MPIQRLATLVAGLVLSSAWAVWSYLGVVEAGAKEASVPPSSVQEAAETGCCEVLELDESGEPAGVGAHLNGELIPASTLPEGGRSESGKWNPCAGLRKATPVAPPESA